MQEAIKLLTEELARLNAERVRIEGAIRHLKGERRGRPRKDAAKLAVVKKRARGWTAAQRAAKAAQMKAMWAKRRKAA